ncbi:MAG: hypothetical protein QOH25_705 [Acidobacteriota bacterium]|jgi:hypothetical protein|nr:hypothetical protein [Acidobacteriota bacterium]
MNKQELRTLKGQLLLLGMMFAGSVVLAVFVALQRGFFEKFIEEKYAQLPANLKPLADAAAEGKLDGEAFNKLSQAERLILYDDWMTRPSPPPVHTPSLLVAVDSRLYLARAERTIVSGSVEQKMRALKFLELAGSRDAIPILRKARQWSIKRRTIEMTAKITETLERLERN